jgi:hypothetical protein
LRIKKKKENKINEKGLLNNLKNIKIRRKNKERQHTLGREEKMMLNFGSGHEQK